MHPIKGMHDIPMHSLKKPIMWHDVHAHHQLEQEALAGRDQPILVAGTRRDLQSIPVAGSASLPATKALHRALMSLVS